MKPIFIQKTRLKPTDATFVPQYAKADMVRWANIFHPLNDLHKIHHFFFRSGHIEYNTLYASNEEEVIILLIKLLHLNENGVVSKSDLFLISQLTKSNWVKTNLVSWMVCFFLQNFCNKFVCKIILDGSSLLWYFTKKSSQGCFNEMENIAPSASIVNQYLVFLVWQIVSEVSEANPNNRMMRRVSLSSIRLL